MLMSLDYTSIRFCSRMLRYQSHKDLPLAFAVLMETAIAMVLLARILTYGVNRWANIVVGVIHTALVSWSLSVTTPTLFYAFFATIEIACTLFIIWYAWTWRRSVSTRSVGEIETAGRAMRDRVTA
jgi:uncharacterized membrane protein